MLSSVQSPISDSIKNLYGIDFSPEISPAPKPELGEYCVNIFPIVKQVGKAPNIISQEVADTLTKNAEIFKGTSATGGYVNFFLTDAVWLDIFQGIKNERPEPKDETIVVDYIGANVGKPLHIGHICTPSIGQAICKVYEYLGYNVIGDSHFGDWGGIFGKLIYAWNELFDLLPNEYAERLHTEMHKRNTHFKQWNDQEKDFWRKNELLENGVQLLLALYAKFHVSPLVDNPEEANEILEERDKGARMEFQYLSGVGIDLTNPDEKKHHEENVELWKKFTSISIAETEKKLDLLNVHATYNIGESFYEGLGLPRPNNEDYPDLEFTMKDIVKELIQKGIATQNEDGSVGVIFPDEVKIPSCILQKKDRTGLYLTSDLAAIKYRLTNGWHPSKIIYSIDVRQQLHLKQAFTIAQMAWPELIEGVEFFHAFNGFIKLKEGAMSTRHGTVILLEKLIEEGFEKTKGILEAKGRHLKNTDIQAITVGAIKYSYLGQDREKDVTFDWDKALNFEGNSGPYIQYAYVRASKIVSESGNTNFDIGDSVLELSQNDKSLIQKLAEFETKVEETAEKYKPHIIALYAYDLAVSFNSFYVHTPKILEEKNEVLKDFRLSLVAKTADILKTTFSLLAIEMPSEM